MLCAKSIRRIDKQEAGYDKGTDTLCAACNKGLDILSTGCIKRIYKLCAKSIRRIDTPEAGCKKNYVHCVIKRWIYRALGVLEE